MTDALRYELLDLYQRMERRYGREEAVAAVLRRVADVKGD